MAMRLSSSEPIVYVLPLFDGTSLFGQKAKFDDEYSLLLLNRITPGEFASSIRELNNTLSKYRLPGKFPYVLAGGVGLLTLAAWVTITILFTVRHVMSTKSWANFFLIALFGILALIIIATSAVAAIIINRRRDRQFARVLQAGVNKLHSQFAPKRVRFELKFSTPGRVTPSLFKKRDDTTQGKPFWIRIRLLSTEAESGGRASYTGAGDIISGITI